MSVFKNQNNNDKLPTSSQNTIWFLNNDLPNKIIMTISDFFAFSSMSTSQAQLSHTDASQHCNF